MTQEEVEDIIWLCFTWRQPYFTWRQTYLKQQQNWNSCCGSRGSAASLERQDAGLIPSLAQNCHCCSCALGLNCGSGMIPGWELRLLQVGEK